MRSGSTEPYLQDTIGAAGIVAALHPSRARGLVFVDGYNIQDIAAASITLEGDADGVTPPARRQANSKRFTGRHQNRIVQNAGYKLPQDAPAAFTEGVLDINAWTRPVRGSF